MRGKFTEAFSNFRTASSHISIRVVLPYLVLDESSHSIMILCFVELTMELKRQLVKRFEAT